MVTVLHVIDSLGVGGAEHQLLDIIVRSDPVRFRHTVCALTLTGGFVQDFERAGIQVHDLHLNTRYDFAWGLRQMLAITRRVKPHILHASLFRAGVLARIAGRLTRTPVVTSLVNTTYEPEWRLDNPRLAPWKVGVLQTLDGVTARYWGTRFVAITHAVKHSAVRQLGLAPEAVVVIPRGFPFGDRPAPAAHAVQIARAEVAPNAYPVVLNVGRLVPQKGQRYLIDAMPHVVEEFPTARLLIAGEGRLRGELDAHIRRLGLEVSVSLLGQRRDVPLLMAAADIFAFPSLYEGFGVSLLEAMASGRPCIVSDIEVLREVTDQGARAFPVPSRNPEALADAIRRLARDPAQAGQLGAAAAQWARAQFDIRGSVRAVETLYESLLDQFHPRQNPRPRWRPDVPQCVRDRTDRMRNHPMIQEDQYVND